MRSIVDDALENEQIDQNALHTPNLRKCLDKARCLAAVLNHPQVGVLHVIAVMALEQCGRRALQVNAVDPDLARANCLDAIIREAPACPGLPKDQIAETGELQDVLGGATTIAMQHYEPVTLNDFTKAVRSQAKTSVSIIEAARPPSPEETRIHNAIEGGLARIETLIDRVARWGQETARENNAALRATHEELAKVGPRIDGFDSKIEAKATEINNRVFRLLIGCVGSAVLSVGAVLLAYLSH